MYNVQGVKIGNVVNLSINGKLYKKVCGSDEEAKNLYSAILTAKNDPTEDNVRAIRILINEKIKIAYLTDLEMDVVSNEVYLKGFSTPIPETLLEVIKEYHANGFPTEPILNFWKLLMINPDKRVRSSLFDFIKTHDFVLTDMGYMLVYKAVYVKEKNKVDTTFNAFIIDAVNKVRGWKTSLNKYVVYKRLSDNQYDITKYTTVENWDVRERNVEIIGKLGVLYDAITLQSQVATEEVYTDMYSRTMTIEIGKPVYMNRTECDADPAVDCSFGLHVGATKYVKSFANVDSKILICLVNPANVVAVPNYDHSKIRVSEYFPMGLVEYNNGTFNPIESKYYPSDYCAYEKQVFESMVKQVMKNEPPISTAINASGDDRSIDELKKMLNNRLYDLYSN